MSAVDDYLIKVNEPERAELERIRHLIKQAAPDAVEVIAYGMPGFKYQNKYLAGFNAHKDHLSFYPTAAPIELYKDQLQDFSLSRGTIRFSVDHHIPEALIKALVLKRVADIGHQTND